MNIDQAKAEIARRAFTAGYAFDPDEIIAGPLEGKTAVFLRSVRAIRAVEQDDGSLIYEEFNSPIVWIDMPSPLLTNPAIIGTTIQYATHAPQVRMLHPEFAIILP